MVHAERITISVTPEMAAMLRREVESGQYNSASEVAREALRDFARKRESETRMRDELSALVREGVNSGAGVPEDQVYAHLLKIVEKSRAAKA